MIKEIEVRGLEYTIDEYGNIYGQDKNIPLKQRLNSDGYPIITLGKKNRRISKYVHRLVAENFVPMVDEKLEVNHIDGNKQNNFYTNLEWMNRKEQMQHASRLGLIADHSGEKNGRSILTLDQVLNIRKEYENKEVSIYRLAKKYHIGWQTANHVVKRTTWTHI